MCHCSKLSRMSHTHCVQSESEEDTVIASTPFGNTLVQHVCRNVSDTEANEAVVNKNWFRQVAGLEATRLQQKKSPSRPLSYDHTSMGF